MKKTAPPTLGAQRFETPSHWRRLARITNRFRIASRTRKVASVRSMGTANSNIGEPSLPEATEKRGARFYGKNSLSAARNFHNCLKGIQGSTQLHDC